MARVLESFGVGMFHMTEFESRLGAFRSLNDDARISFIGQLIDLVGQHAFVGIGAAIVLDDYDALEQEERKLLGHGHWVIQLEFCRAPSLYSGDPAPR